ncbi:hypothetical protein PRK78_003295 [Emydomyces testavorans]|uniref:Ankyrin n=1 Tax=Emydomyces testavorans TaxID=2070801 RepID=A0AAF0DGJ4_9EURO|nr:hypothetical protein PRK78_003295 [Emydomyces testavorans]
MTLLQLPLELFQQILDLAVVSLGVLEAKHLRLVNKFFDRETLRSYARNKLFLDTGRILDRCKLSGFIATYLLERPHATALANDNLSSFVNNVVDKITSHDPKNTQLRHQYIKTLCAVIEKKNHAWGGILPYLFPSKARFPSKAISNIAIEYHAFVAAIHTEQTDLFQYLPVEDGNNVRRVESDRLGHPLEVAVKMGNHDLVGLLLEHGADPKAALREAIYMRDTQSAFLLLNPKYGFPCEPDRPFEDAVDSAIYVELHSLVYYMFERIGNRLPEFKQVVQFSFTTACQHGMLDIAERLLAAGADMNARKFSDGFYPNPISQAAWAGHKHIVRFLLSKGANPSGSPDNSPPYKSDSMCAVAWGGHIKIATLLLDAGAEAGNWLNVFEVLAYTPESIEIARLLFDRGLFNPSEFAKHTYGDYAIRELMVVACAHDNPGFARLLVQHGIPLDEDNGFYSRHDFPAPVVIAKACLKPRVKQMLLELGAVDVDPLNSIWREKFLSGEFPCEPNYRRTCEMPHRAF